MQKRLYCLVLNRNIKKFCETGAISLCELSTTSPYTAFRWTSQFGSESEYGNTYSIIRDAKDRWDGVKWTEVEIDQVELPEGFID